MVHLQTVMDSSIRFCLKSELAGGGGWTNIKLVLHAERWFGAGVGQRDNYIVKRAGLFQLLRCPKLASDYVMVRWENFMLVMMGIREYN